MESKHSQTTRRAFTQGMLIAAAGAAVAPHLHAGEPLATTRSGRISGQIDEGVYVFKGIPYGASTAGEGRFRPARPPASWSGVRPAVAYGPAAPQRPSALFTDSITSEDCLVLNVWTRGLADGGRRPVMVWLHGGGFSTLSGSSPMYDGTSLCNRGDVVVVTLNHRLNVFGFLHLGDLGGEAYAQSGNVGIVDIVLALEWVRDNIDAFGGDAGNVTIFGESGGGRKVSTLLAMPAAQGLFHRAIIQSGPGIHLQPRDLAEEMTLALLTELGISRNGLKALHSVSADALLAACAKVEGGLDAEARSKGRNEQRGFVPTVGTEALPTFAFDPVASPLAAPIPLLVGTNRHELALFARADPAFYDRTLTEEALALRVRGIAGSAAARVLETYARVHPGTAPAVRWILMLSDRTYRTDSILLAQRKAALPGAPTWMYFFTWESREDPKLLAHHALEIPFVFDNTSRVTTWSGGGPEAAALAARMSEAWIAFARKGDPDTAALPQWPTYDRARRATMVFDDTCAVVDDPDAEIRRLWATV
jgi:para-nitrobenzyl esterase